MLMRIASLALFSAFLCGSTVFAQTEDNGEVWGTPQEQPAPPSPVPSAEPSEAKPPEEGSETPDEAELVPIEAQEGVAGEAAGEASAAVPTPADLDPNLENNLENDKDPAAEPEGTPSASPKSLGDAKPEVRLPGGRSALEKTPGSQPPPRWEDADEMIEVAAEGSIETCEALTFPLTFIPAIGSVIGSVIEWACLFPAAAAVDYTQAFHGNRSSLLWQAGLGLVVAKLWREVFKYAGLAAVIGLVGAGFGIAGALAFTAPYYIPVAIAGLLTAGGVGFLVWKRVRSSGADLLFGFTYWLLTGEIESEEHRAEVRERAPVKYALTGANRAWALMATAAGAQPERQLWYYIPVVGAWGKAMARAEAVKSGMRRTGDDVLDEERVRGPDAYATMDTVIDVFAYAEGGLMATAHALLLGGGTLYVVGTTLAAIQFQGENDFTNYALLAGSVGTLGIVVASGGLVALGAREITKAFRPFAAPFAYGFIAPEPGELEANAE